MGLALVGKGKGTKMHGVYVKHSGNEQNIVIRDNPGSPSIPGEK